MYVLHWISLLFLSLAGCLFGLPCHAQPLGKTIVVPFWVGSVQADFARSIDLATEVEAALRPRRSALISFHDARDRFEARARDPQVPSSSDLDALAKEAQLAIEHVAFGHTAAAQRSVRRIVELAERSLETLNRETGTARTLLDACLALVRASLHDNKRDAAIEQAMRCRRLVPDLAPSEVAHPATVIGALAEADDQLRRMRVGNLAVQALPERGCDVYLNGRHLGHTPFALDRAPVGDYRVQVECNDRPGRVHLVQLGEDPVQLSVDTVFDESVHTDPRIALHYASADQARGLLVSHASRAGRDVRAEDVLLVGMLDSQLTLLRVQVRHERLVAGSKLAGTEAIAQGVDALVQALFSGLQPEEFRPRNPSERLVAAAATPTEAAQTAVPAQASAPTGPTTLSASAPKLEASSRRHARALRITGGVLTAVGLVLLGTGVGLEAHAQGLKDDAVSAGGTAPSTTAQHKYDDFRMLPLVGIAGVASTAAGLPMLMPRRGPRGAAAWVGGALAGAAAIALMVVGAVQARDDAVLGSVIGSAGVPLFGIPISQLVHAARRP